jgi:hypothetical protein
MRDVVTAREGYKRPIKSRNCKSHWVGERQLSGQGNSESRMRENRSSGLMRGGKQAVTGPRAFQTGASRLLYTPHPRTQTPEKAYCDGANISFILYKVLRLVSELSGPMFGTIEYYE